MSQRRASRTFLSRTHAGRELARELATVELEGPLHVLGLPRGGVPVAREIADALEAPLDVLVVRKIGMPGQPELAIGAIASGGVVLRIHDPPRLVGGEVFDRIVARERVELERRERAYRAGVPPLDLRGGTAILVDDGLATGSTMLAAICAARAFGARKVVAAVPVASQQAAELVGAQVDRLVALCVPSWLNSIGEFYEDFEQLTDAEVTGCLGRGAAREGRGRW